MQTDEILTQLPKKINSHELTLICGERAWVAKYAKSSHNWKTETLVVNGIHYVARGKTHFEALQGLYNLVFG